MSFDEYTSHDGLGLAERVRDGEVSPAELVVARCWGPSGD